MLVLGNWILVTAYTIARGKRDAVCASGRPGPADARGPLPAELKRLLQHRELCDRLVGDQLFWAPLALDNRGPTAR
jgi:hypothetical protein